MKPPRILIGALAILALAASTAAVAATSDGHGSRGNVVGYFTEWGIYGRNYTVKNIATSGSAARLSVIDYAFANVAPDSSGNVVCKLADEWADYQKP
jgi:chitinase